MRFRSEPDDVYAVLVADLPLTTVPTTIMGLTLVGIGAVAYSTTGSPVFLAATILGAIASAAKLFVMWLHRRRNARGCVPASEAARWEALNAAATVAVATSVGLCACTIFRSPHEQLHLLATGLLFGYCSGIVGRVAIRPLLASLALLVAILPSLAAIFTWNDPSHLLIGSMFIVFLGGAFESVRYVHRSTVRHVTLRLEMAALAREDALTGLANRLGLRDGFEGARRRKESVVLFCLDLDGFKAVNDTFGHPFGDAVLKAVAQRLREVTPPSAVAARLGGDEFAVLVPSVDPDTDARSVAEAIDKRLREPFLVAERRVAVGASVGYASGKAATEDLDDMLRLADEASYSVKRRSGSVEPAAQAARRRLSQAAA